MSSRKAVSPMIATVLIIAFTVAVGGVVSLWMRSFAQTTTEEVTDVEEEKIYCSNAAISASNFGYCNQRLWGAIENTKYKPLGDITVQVFWTNYTSAQTIYLCQNGTSCPTAEMELSPQEEGTFNVTIGGTNYQEVHIYTNCSNAYHDVENSYITAC